MSGRLPVTTGIFVAYSQKLFQLLYMAMKNPSLIVNAFKNLITNGYRSTINEIINTLHQNTSCHRQEVETAERYCVIVKAIECAFNNHGQEQQHEKEQILLITHYFARSGAPLLLLNIARELHEKHARNIFIISLDDGELRGEFEKYGTVLCLGQPGIGSIVDESLVDFIFGQLSDHGVCEAIGNTTGSALFVPFLEKYGFNYQILIHEMPEIIELIGWDKTAAPHLPGIASGRLVYSSKYVLGTHRRLYDLPVDVEIIPQGVFQVQRKQRNEQSRAELLSRYKIPGNARIILHGGKDIVRKGLDLFIDIALDVSAHRQDIYFIFLCDEHELATQKEMSRRSNDIPNVIIDSFTVDYGKYLEGSDIYALTSRADPFPNTVLDALSHGLPVIAFDECGGAPELLREIDEGLVARKLDVEDFSRKITCLLEQPEKYLEIARKAVELMEKDYGFGKYVDGLLSYFMFAYRFRVSVIVPNFNYSKFLPERLHSIINQTLKPYEIIFLDDNSADNSCEIAEPILAGSGIKYRILKNSSNQGVFKQWCKGIELVEGDLVWIAEADDYCSKYFLKTLVPRFVNSDVQLAYCHSSLVAEDGAVLSEDGVLLHAKEIDSKRWKHSFVCTGMEEIRKVFLFKNLIINSGMCVFRRAACSRSTLEMLGKFKFVGDWFFYVELLLSGKVLHSNKVLACFRRHDAAVTNKHGFSQEYFNEVLAVIERLMIRLRVSEREYDGIRRILKKDYDTSYDQDRVDSLRRNVQKIVKILFVATNPSAQEGGGADVLWFEAAKSLAGQNYEIFLNVYDCSVMARKVRTLEELGVNVSYYSKTGVNILDDGCFDVVVIVQGDERDGASWLQQCHVRNIRYLIVNQLTKPDVSVSSVIRSGYRNAAKVFFTCENNRLLMEGKMGCKLGNAARHFNPVAGIDRAFEMPFPSAKDDKYYLACPARLITIHKGQDVLFELLKQDKWKGRELHINLYGDGPDKETLMEMKHSYQVDKINFCGYERDVNQIWIRNHGIIMPSRMEGVPIVLLGAMLCSRVPVLTDVGGHRELVEDNVSGFIAKAPIIEYIDDALERAWQHRESWCAIGRNARESVLAFQPDDPVGDFIGKITK